MKDLIQYADTMKPEEFPTEDLRIMADEIGVEATIKLCLRFSGSHVYFKQEVEKDLVKRKALAIFCGNACETARKCGVTSNTIYRWVKEAAQTRRDADSSRLPPNL